MSAPMLLTPLRTEGAKILDAAGNQVKIASVNVGGFPLFFEQWFQDQRLETTLDKVRQFGFNSIRLPIFSQLFIDPNPPINRNDIAVNHPKLAQLSTIDMLDAFITEAGKRDLGVVLDMHKNKFGDFQTELWYQTGNPDDPSDTVFVGFNHPQNRWTDRINEPTLVQLWVALAGRYRDNLTVIGYDLFNEPHGRATWGDGGPTDWRRAAGRLGDAIHQIDPSKLLFVDGIGPDSGPLPPDHTAVKASFWGENLNRAAEFPLVRPQGECRNGGLNNVVYSPHDYGPSVFPQFWLNPINPSAMREVWERLWGYLARNNIAPIWVGEFGQPNLSAQDPGGQQVRQLLDYLHEIGAHFSYWMLHDHGSADTGGLAMATIRGGYLAAVPEKLEVVSHYLTPMDATFGQGRVVCRNGFVPKYERFDTTERPDFPPAPRDAQGVSIPRPTVVSGPDQAEIERCAIV